jgi:hypothetical protein
VIDGASGHQLYQASELDLEDGTKIFFDDVKTHDIKVGFNDILTKFRIEAHWGRRNQGSAIFQLQPRIPFRCLVLWAAFLIDFVLLQCFFATSFDSCLYTLVFTLCVGFAAGKLDPVALRFIGQSNYDDLRLSFTDRATGALDLSLRLSGDRADTKAFAA